MSNILEISSLRCRGSKHNLHHGPFIIDPDQWFVECKSCKEKLNPIHVLTELAHEESRLWRTFQHLKEQINKLDKKTKYKCKSCNKYNYK